jgi:hypothetical protein
MHPAAALQDAEDRGFAAGTPAAFAKDAGSTEEVFIDFHLANEGAVAGGDLGHVARKRVKRRRVVLQVEAVEFGGLGGGEIGAEKAQDLTELGL